MPSPLIKPGAPALDTLANFPELSERTAEKGQTQHLALRQEGGNAPRLLRPRSARALLLSGREVLSGEDIWAKA